MNILKGYICVSIYLCMQYCIHYHAPHARYVRSARGLRAPSGPTKRGSALVGAALRTSASRAHRQPACVALVQILTPVRFNMLIAFQSGQLIG